MMHVHVEETNVRRSDCIVQSLSWMGKVPDTLPEGEGWKLNRTTYYQEGWLATGNAQGLVGVTFTACHCKKNFDWPTRSNFNLRGHRSEVTIVRWNEPYQKLATCDEAGVIYVWIKHEGRWSVELINDRNSQVTDFSWSHDGRMALICYRDGFVLVGSVAGQRFWSSTLSPNNCHVTCGVWSPDDQQVLFGTSNGQLVVMSSMGAMLSQTTLIEGQEISSMAWSCEKFNLTEDGSESSESVKDKADGDRGCTLAVSCKNGDIHLLKSLDTLCPQVIHTRITGIQMEWSNDGRLLAVGGFTRLPNLQCQSEVHFYSRHGVLRYRLPVGMQGKPMTSLTWGHNDRRVFVGIGCYIYTLWVTKKVSPLQFLCHRRIQQSLSQESHVRRLPLPSKLRASIATLFSPTIKGVLPPPDRLSEFVCVPRPAGERLYCTMMKQQGGEEPVTAGGGGGGGGCYTLYLEYLGGFVPLLWGKRASKLKPEFIIYEPRLRSAREQAENGDEQTPGNCESEASLVTTVSTSSVTSSHCSPQCSPRMRTPRQRSRSKARAKAGATSSTGEVAEERRRPEVARHCTEEQLYDQQLSEDKRLLAVTSNIWGTRFRLQGLAPYLPDELGSVMYKTSLLHLQPRQMTISIVELSKCPKQHTDKSQHSRPPAVSRPQHMQLNAAPCQHSLVSTSCQSSQLANTTSCQHSQLYQGQSQISCPSDGCCGTCHSSTSVSAHGHSHAAVTPTTHEHRPREEVAGRLKLAAAGVDKSWLLVPLELLPGAAMLQSCRNSHKAPPTAAKTPPTATPSAKAPPMRFSNGLVLGERASSGTSPANSDAAPMTGVRDVCVPATPCDLAKPRGGREDCERYTDVHSSISQRCCEHPNCSEETLASGPSTMCAGHKQAMNSCACYMCHARAPDIYSKEEDSLVKPAKSCLPSSCEMPPLSPTQIYTYETRGSLQHVSRWAQPPSDDLAYIDADGSEEMSATEWQVAEGVQADDVTVKRALHGSSKRHDVTARDVTTLSLSQLESHSALAHMLALPETDASKRVVLSRLAPPAPDDFRGKDTPVHGYTVRTRGRAGLEVVRSDSSQKAGASSMLSLESLDSAASVTSLSSSSGTPSVGCFASPASSPSFSRRFPFIRRGSGGEKKRARASSATRVEENCAKRRELLPGTCGGAHSLSVPNSPVHHPILNNAVAKLMSGEEVGENPRRSRRHYPLTRKHMRMTSADSSDDEGGEGGVEGSAMDAGKSYHDLATFQKAQLSKKIRRARDKADRDLPDNPSHSPTRAAQPCKRPSLFAGCEPIVMHNKAPLWNDSSQVYQLDFGGRVTQESAKNFQIEHGGQQVMQFGRIDNHAYTLDFQYPFSCVQAFGVALANVTQRLK